MSGWTDDGTVVRLDDPTDQVGIGTAIPAKDRMLEVTGLARLALEDKGGEVYNVKAYGAKGDDATDDTAAIQSAVDAVPLSGGIVFFPPGIYLVSGTIDFGDRTLLVIGSGARTSVVKTSDATADVFLITATTSATDVSFPSVARDLGFDASVSRTAGAAIKQQLTAGPKSQFGIRIENCRFTRQWYSIHLTAATGAVIENCTFSEEKSTAVRLENAANPDAGDHTIVACYFAGGAAQPQTQYAVWASDGGSGLRIVNDKFLVYDHAVYVDVPSGDTCNVLHIKDNSIERCRKASIRLGGDGAFNGIEIEDTEIGTSAPLGTSATCLLIEPSGAVFDTIDVRGCWFAAGTPTDAIGIDLAPAPGATRLTNVQISQNFFNGFVQGSPGKGIGVNVAAGVGPGRAWDNVFSNVTTPYANVSTAFTVGSQACRATHGGNQPISTGTNTILRFNGERFDTETMHVAGPNDSRITIKTPGLYTVGAQVQWQNNGIGIRQVALKLNGATYIAINNQAASSASLVTRQEVSTLRRFAANDFIQVEVFHDSSQPSLQVQKAQGEISPEFWAARISD